MAILLLLTAGTVIAGIVGALLAIPFGAVVWEAVRHFRERPAPPEELGSGAVAAPADG